ncbi:LuxR family transcriptional regulator [Rhodopseudomonas sp. B29]|uniref:LuxR family transcriptional regulator n=1 Tax=Rhodopseudomonas sp. B29 TaxID=95607 RepID=UPI0003B77AD2|nr:LuxR family transcriptional regulator [Rhodopseudomonas sp. B29]
MSVVGPDQISRAIGSIYEGTSDASAWPRAIEQLRQLFNASRCCLTRFGPDVGPGDVINPTLDAEFQSRYVAEFAGTSTEFADALNGAPTGEILLEEALVGAERLHRSRFWNEWMVPQDMYDGLGAKVLTSGSSFWYLGVHRGRHQQVFAPADVELMRLIASHLTRATEIFHKFSSARVATAAQSALPFGVVIVDAGLHVHDLNEAAQRIVASPQSPLRLKRGVLSTADRRTSLALQQLVSNVCAVQEGMPPGAGGDLMVRANPTTGEGERGEIGRDVALSVVPLPAASLFPPLPQAVIYLREVTLELPDPFEDQVRQLFDLSPAEARLATALASGISLKEAAARQGIRFSTARSYLEGIFRKTRTRQQSQLVALLKTTQPVIRSH